MATSAKRSQAMKGNDNASKHGVRAGVIGAFLPAGAFVTGAALGAAGKNSRALSRHSTVNTVLGGSAGASAGMMAGGPVGAIVGMPVGATVNYGLGKLGHVSGRALAGKKRK